MIGKINWNEWEIATDEKAFTYYKTKQPKPRIYRFATDSWLSARLGIHFTNSRLLVLSVCREVAGAVNSGVKR